MTLEVADEDGLSNETRTQVAVESVETATETTTEDAAGEPNETASEDGGGGGGETAEPDGGTTRPEDDDDDEPSAQGTGSDGSPGFGVASGVAGVAAAGYLLDRRLDDDE